MGRNGKCVLLFVNQVGLAALFESFGFSFPAFDDVGDGAPGLQISSSDVCAVHFVEHSPIFAALDGVLKQISPADSFYGVEQVEVDGAQRRVRRVLENDFHCRHGAAFGTTSPRNGLSGTKPDAGQGQAVQIGRCFRRLEPIRRNIFEGAFGLNANV